MIGEGNFGVVCKMEHEKSETMMAVKVINNLNLNIYILFFFNLNLAYSFNC